MDQETYIQSTTLTSSFWHHFLVKINSWCIKHIFPLIFFHKRIALFFHNHLIIKISFHVVRPFEPRARHEPYFVHKGQTNDDLQNRRALLSDRLLGIFHGATLGLILTNRNRWKINRAKNQSLEKTTKIFSCNLLELICEWFR